MLELFSGPHLVDKKEPSDNLAPKNARNLNKKIVEVAQALRIQAQYSIMQ
ncbi:hypothetical protein [Candidatus Chlorobium masyuteum]|nr:hypothetical protein [Candidatus Chlorobium masyuteum]